MHLRKIDQADDQANCSVDLRRRSVLLAAAGVAGSVWPLAQGQTEPGRRNAPAASREMQLQLLDQVNVLDYMSEVQRAGVLGGKASVDVTAAVQACLEAVMGRHKTVRFPAGTYLMGRVFPRSNTILWLDGGVTLKKKADGVSLLRAANVENVHILANGAQLDGTAADASSSHTVYFDSARNCSIRDANVIGSAHRKDCIYIGEASQGPSQDVLILGGSCIGARRNGISVVAGVRTVIDGVEISGTTGAPGAGIDVESNVFDRALETEIRNCRIHGNQSYGIVVVFGHGVKIHHNAVFGNLQDGIGGAAGGYQFDQGVYRPNVDVRGVARFDPASGRVLVGGRAASLPAGTLVLFKPRNGARLPGTLGGSRRWIVNETREVGAGVEIILAAALDHDIQNGLTDAGSGRMSLDPALSDIQLVCYVKGQCSGIEIFENQITGNLRRAISMITAVDVSIGSNQIVHGGTMSAIQVSYVQRAVLTNNAVGHDGSAGGTGGILIAASTSASSKGNRIVGFPDSGIDLGSASRTRLEDDVVLNCGTRNGAPVRLRASSGLEVARMRIRNDASHAAAFGLRTESVLGSVFRDIDATGAGDSNANSIAVGDNLLLNSRLRDGSVHSSRTPR